MRVKCDHGFYKFYPKTYDEIQRFSSLYNEKLEKCRDFYTFPLLAGLGTYGVRGLLFANTPLTKTYSGEPWEVMKENRLIYSLSLKALTPFDSIMNTVNIMTGSNYYFSKTFLIQAGSISNGKRLLSFDGEIDSQLLSIRLRGVDFD